MTREQAIDVLKNRYYSGVTRSRPDDEWRLATDTALAALRDAQARQEGCVNCKNRFWYFTDYRFNPNYCPSCGRHLEPVGNADMLPGASDQQVKNPSQGKQNDSETAEPSSYQQVKEGQE